MTFDELLTITQQVVFQNYTFYVGRLGNGFYLQVRFYAQDNYFTDEPKVQHGRKWYVSPYMSESEVVQTALKAVLTSVEHEAREQFLYKGKAIFGPHLNVERLLEMADDTVQREKVGA